MQDNSLATLQGIGKATVKKLNKIGGMDKPSMLEVFPRRYIKYPYPVSPGQCMEGNMVAVKAVVGGDFKSGKGNSMKLKLYDPDGGDPVYITWFGMPFVARMLNIGMEYVFLGNTKVFNGYMCMSQPTFYKVSDYNALSGTLEPVYPLTEGLKNATVAKVQDMILKETDSVEEIIPDDVVSKYHLLTHLEALRKIHQPKTEEDAIQARRRFIFEELFAFMLKVRYRSANREPNRYPMIRSAAWEKVYRNIPYDLTASQAKAIKDMIRDFTGEYASNRLVQGDVGSGKTIVAFAGMIIAADNGYQAALMAPTEVLARQHYRDMCDMLEKNGLLEEFAPCLLVGSLKPKEKEEAREAILSGRAKIVIGTHALFQEKVEYNDLALVITDEQHRFGAAQREMFSGKGARTPHTIIMSATPIPQTLGKTIYGDLDISEMKEKPSRRLEIKNCVVTESMRPKVVAFIRSELQKGRQAYVICPMVEALEDSVRHDIDAEVEMIKKDFPEYQVGKMHGHMDAEEKDRVMQDFSSGRTAILVSTTVVEVGVNVPNASVILIEDADMFGMLQLHQLRGRVGRGSEQSYCIFMKSSIEESEKLDVLWRSNDGFHIAEEDFRMRGAGDLFGDRQSGSMGFKLADLSADADILMQADEAAKEALEWDKGLYHPTHKMLRRIIEEQFGDGEEKTC